MSLPDPLPPRREWLALGAVAAVATLVAFAPVLGWPFTDADAWPDVAWARHPLAEQLGVRLTGGVAGNDANFWRPTAMIQFWLQRRLFGWTPLGWHAWDLAEHALVSVLAGLLAGAGARAAGAPSRGVMWGTTLLFVAHPLTEDVVPAVARNLDLLLGLGTFGALVALALAQAGRRWAWGAHTLLAAVAIGAKESAVLLPVLVAGWVLLFRGELGRGPRLRAALLAAAPSAGLVLLFLVGRARVLTGVGGYAAELDPAWILPAMGRGLVEPIFPALAHSLPAGWRTLVPVAALAALTIGAGWRSPHRRLVAFGVGWFFLAGLLHAVTGTLSRRVMYVPTLAALLVAVPALLHAARSWPGRFVGGAWLLTFAYGSPLFLHYTQWRELSRASERYRDPAFWAAFPVGTHVWLAERPFRADLDPRTFRWKSDSALHHGATAYAVQAWLDEVLPDQRLEVDTLTGTSLRVPLAEQTVAVRVEGDTLVVDAPGAERQDWEIRSPFRVEHDGTTLRVTPRRLRLNDVVVVWTPEGPVAWTPGTSTLRR